MRLEGTAQEEKTLRVGDFMLGYYPFLSHYHSIVPLVGLCGSVDEGAR